MRPRGKRRASVSILYAFLLSSGPVASLWAWEPPPEPPRVRQSFLTALYAPSFGLFTPSSYPLNDYFSVDGGWVNLFPKGDNLNFYYGIGHSISDLPLFPSSSPSLESLDLVQQARDSLYGKVTYAFLDYFQLNGGVEYLQNRKVAPATGYEDYDYDRLSFSEALSWDMRYSSIETYYKGKIFLYPEQGIRVSGGLLENLFFPAGDSLAGGSATLSPQAFGEIQYLFHPGRMWVIALDGTGRLTSSPSHPASRPRYPRCSARWIRQGIMLSTPMSSFASCAPMASSGNLLPFGTSAASSFKFSPGFILGYDAGTIGIYRDGSRIIQQSVYASPLVAIRMNGDLETVLRADFSAASSGLYKVVLSLSVGTVGGGKPISPLLQNGIR